MFEPPQTLNPASFRRVFIITTHFLLLFADPLQFVRRFTVTELVENFHELSEQSGPLHLGFGLQ